MTILTSKLGVSVGNLLGLNEGTNVEISVGIKLGLVVEGPLEVGPTESMNTGSAETVTIAVSQINSTPSSKHASYSKSSPTNEEKYKSLAVGFSRPRK